MNKGNLLLGLLLVVAVGAAVIFFSNRQCAVKKDLFIVANAGGCFSEYYETNPARLTPRIKEVIPQLNRSTQYAGDKLEYAQELPMPEDLYSEFCNTTATKKVDESNQARCKGYLYVGPKYHKPDSVTVHPKQIEAIYCRLTVKCRVTQTEFDKFKKSILQAVDKFPKEAATIPQFSADELDVPERCVTEHNGKYTFYSHY
ncbi:MAG TPA: hypothetical protein VJB34_10630 [Bdellovibrionota bacterium]|nr:hypothetical protein [Bdellovibrionota bacterium]